MSTFTHALSTNNYGPAKFIVSTSNANGTHSTLASAMSAATSGDTIFLRDSVTENVTITPGVNIVGWVGSSLNVPSITGTLTMSAAGTSTLNNLRLITNSAPAITVSGSTASILNIFNCQLNFTNNTGITFSSSSSSAMILLKECRGDLGTTGIGLYTSTSPGQLAFNYCAFTNSGASTTASSTSSGNIAIGWSTFSSPLSTSSTGNVVISYSNFNTSAQNATCLTTAGTGSSIIEYSDFISGTASAVSIGTGTIVSEYGPCQFNSTNTNPVTGAGTFIASASYYAGTGISNNVTTQTYYAGSSWSLISTKTASNSATLSWTNLAGFNNYVLVYSGVIPVTNTTNLVCQISINNGSSYIATGYFSGQNGFNYNSATLGNNNSTTGFLMGGNFSNSATTGAAGTIYLYDFTSGNYTKVNGFAELSSAASAAGALVAGTNTNTSVVNAIQLLMSSGNINTGKFTLFGIPA